MNESDQFYLSISLVPPFSDQFQVSSKLLRETEEVRQNISKLSKEVGRYTINKGETVISEKGWYHKPVNLSPRRCAA